MAEERVLPPQDLRPDRHRHGQIQNMKNKWRIPMGTPFFTAVFWMKTGFFLSLNQYFGEKGGDRGWMFAAYVRKDWCKDGVIMHAFLEVGCWAGEFGRAARQFIKCGCIRCHVHYWARYMHCIEFGI